MEECKPLRVGLFANAVPIAAIDARRLDAATMAGAYT